MEQPEMYFEPPGIHVTQVVYAGAVSKRLPNLSRNLVYAPTLDVSPFATQKQCSRPGPCRFTIALRARRGQPKMIWEK